MNIFTAELAKKNEDLDAERYPEEHLKSLLPTFTPINMEHLDEKVKDDKGKQRQERVKKISGSASGVPSLDYDEALYFGDSKYSKLMSYFQNLERILTLELFINKLQFNHREVVYLDNAIENGLPFWQETDYEAFLNKETSQLTVTENENKLSQHFLFS